MAMSRDPRRGERGLSLIEALIIVSVTALLALLLLPLVSSAANRNFQRANHALDLLETASAEARYRSLLAWAVQDERAPLVGNEAGVTFFTSPDAASPCAPAGPPTAVRLRIVSLAKGGRLLCDARGHTFEELHWSEGLARFSYSLDGRVWSSSWEGRSSNSESAPQSARGGAAAPTYSAPLVRFELSGGNIDVEWVGQAGWTEPTRLEAEAAP